MIHCFGERYYLFCIEHEKLSKQSETNFMDPFKVLVKLWDHINIKNTHLRVKKVFRIFETNDMRYAMFIFFLLLVDNISTNFNSLSSEQYSFDARPSLNLVADRKAAFHIPQFTNYFKFQDESFNNSKLTSLSTNCDNE